MLNPSDEGKSGRQKQTLKTQSAEGERFKRQIEFILEADKLKRIARRTTLLDVSRQENSAEHSWQKYGIQKKQVVARMQPVSDGSLFLWEYISGLIDDAVQQGFLAE